MATVDVVIPCHNYARFLTRSVQSVLSQHDVVVRVLIIDDCSSDETAVVGAALAKADARVHFRRHAQNRGHIATYNEGLLEWAAADYSVLLSADDALAPGALQRAASLMDAHPDVVMAYGLARVVADLPDADQAEDSLSADYRLVPGREFIDHCCEFSNPVPTPCAVVRTRVQQSIGGYRADLPHTGDMEMWMRFALHGSVGVIHRVQGYYRWHERNMSQHYYAALLSDQRERLKACTDLLETLNGTAPHVAESLKKARRRVAHEAFWLAQRAFDAGNVRDCEASLAFARERWPGVTRQRDWRRFAIKQRLGVRLWRRIYPVVDALRGREGARRQRSRRFQPGDTTGWWPGSAG